MGSDGDRIGKYEGLMKRIARKFVWVLPPLAMDVEDLHAEGRMAVLRAVRSYDAGNKNCRGKESSYVGKCVVRAFADLAKAAVNPKRGGDGVRRCVDVVAFEDWMLVAFSFADEVDARSDLRQLRRRLPEALMALLVLRFGYGYGLRDLSELTGLGLRAVDRKLEEARIRAAELLAA